MGLKPEFEALRTQILNTTPFPSLYEAFATIDGDERRRRILSSHRVPEPSSVVPDQMAFAAPSGSRSGGPRTTLGGHRPYIGSTRPFCQHCRTPGHTIDRCFDCHPELKQ